MSALSFEGMNPSPPERRSFLVDGVYHQRAPADERRGSHTTLKRVFQQAGSYAAASPTEIGRELTEQQARHGIGRLARSDGSRQDI